MHLRELRGRRVAPIVFSVMMLLLGSASGAVGQMAGYHDFDALTDELRRLATSSGAAEIRALGSSISGREIWMMQIAEPGGEAIDDRPGVLVVGNLEGDQVAGSEYALGVIRYLLGDSEAAAAVRRDQVVYVVPRLNPDAAEAMFASVLWQRRGNARPVDDDNDARTDEDPAEDLNGDGVVTMMRVPDPEGAYIVDSDDPRVMKPASASDGESGAYSLYWEGVDSDGDGFYNEDGPGGVDLNRNFQHAYPYWQADAGRHMVSEPETRALMDFVVAQRNIGAILTFSASDNLVNDYDGQGNPGGLAGLDLVAYADASNADVHEVGVFNQGFGGFGGFGFFFGGGGGGGLNLRGAQVGRDNDPSSGRRPETTFNAGDRAYFSAVSDAYKEVTGNESVGLSRAAEGAFFQFGYFHYGVPSFSTPGWWPTAASDDDSGSDDDAPAGRPATAGGPPAGRGGPPAGRGGFAGRGGGGGGGGGGARGGSGAPGADASVLAAMEGAGIDGFVDWTSFEHPELGSVEIGGFRPYATSNPPADQLAGIGERQGEFVARLAGMLPRIGVASAEVVNRGGGVFTVSVTVENTGYFPTTTRQGMTSRAVQPTMVQIQVDADRILTGADKTSMVQRLEGSGGRESFTWVIRGRTGEDVEIRVRSQKGGSASATVTLR